MRDVIVMLLALFVIFHGVTRLGHMPKLVWAPWRTKVLILSVLMEFTGAVVAFGEALMHSPYYVSTGLLLFALALTPLADPRLGRRAVNMREAR